jgi:hypothetical protein
MTKLNMFIALVIIILLLTVSVGFGYLQIEINTLKNPNNPATNPSHPTITQGSTATPTPIPVTSGSPANLIVKIDNITYDYVPDYHSDHFLVEGSITNIGGQTAYNVSIHTQVRDHNGALVMDIVSYLSEYKANEINFPNTDLSLAGGVMYKFDSVQSNLIPVALSAARSFWLNASGKITSTTMDVASYSVTPLWSNN